MGQAASAPGRAVHRGGNRLADGGCGRAACSMVRGHMLSAVAEDKILDAAGHDQIALRIARSDRTEDQAVEAGSATRRSCPGSYVDPPNHDPDRGAGSRAPLPTQAACSAARELAPGARRSRYMPPGVEQWCRAVSNWHRQGIKKRGRCPARKLIFCRALKPLSG